MSDTPAAPTADDIEQSLNSDMRYQLLTGPDRVLKRKQVYERLGVQPPTAISTPGKKELDEEGPVHKYVRPALEMGGMMGGAVLGAALPPPLTGPIGGALGGTLGYAGGDTLASLVERLAGERPPVQSVEQALGETARSVTGGGALEMGSRIVGKGLGSVISKAAAPFAKQYEGASKTLDEMAQSKGIQLDPHELLQSRPVALAHKTLENIPFTAGMIQRKELKKVADLTNEWTRIREATGTKDRQRLGDLGQKIQDTVERELDRIGIRQGEIRDEARDTILQSVGSPLSYRELGTQTQQAITQHHEGLKDLEKLAWNAAKGAVQPDARLITTSLPTAAKDVTAKYENLPAYTDENLLGKLRDAQGSGNKKYDAIVAQAMKDVPEGLPPAMRKKIVNDAIAASGEKPGWKLDDLMTMRSELSQLAAEHHTGIQRGNVQQGSSDAYGRIFNQLKDAIDQDIAAFGETQGSNVADLFAAARASTGTRKGLFNAKEHPGIARAIKSDPATIASALIKPGSAAGYTELSRLVGQEASRPVKEAFTNQLLGVGGREAEGLPGLRNRINQYGTQTLAEVYNERELQNLYHLSNQSQWIAHSPIGNPLFRELVKESPKSVAPTILGHTDLTSKVLRQFPQMRGDLRAAFLEGLHPNQMTPFPTQMLKHLNAYPADVQKQLFSKGEIRDFYDLAQIVEKAKGSVKMAEGPSGTAQGIISFESGRAVLRNPITAAPRILGTVGIAKLYLSPMGRRFLLEGLRPPISPERSLYVTSQILGIAGSDAVRDATEP